MSSRFDPSALRRLRDRRSEAFLAGLIDFFLREAPARLEEAWRAGRGKDWHGAAHAAHVLACLAGNVGAVEVGRLAELAEEAAAGMAVRRDADWSAAVAGPAYPRPVTDPSALSSLLFELEIALAEANACLDGVRPRVPR